MKEFVILVAEFLLENSGVFLLPFLAKVSVITSALLYILTRALLLNHLIDLLGSGEMLFLSDNEDTEPLETRFGSFDVRSRPTYKFLRRFPSGRMETSSPSSPWRLKPSTFVLFIPFKFSVPTPFGVKWSARIARTSTITPIYQQLPVSKA